MIPKKAVRFLGTILIFIFCFQLLPLTSSAFESGSEYAQINKHVQSDKFYITASSIQNDAVLIGNENGKFSFKLPLTYLKMPIQAQSTLQDYSIHIFNLRGIVIDSRQKIHDAISNHFHGSKYKDNCLYI